MADPVPIRGLFFELVGDEVVFIGERPGSFQASAGGAGGEPRLTGSRLLALHVACAPDRPATSEDFRAAPVSIDAARRVAAALLQVAFANALAAQDETAAEELWREIDGTFRRVALTGEAELNELARSLGIDDGSRSAKEVCVAIVEELLPVLHALCLFKGAGQSREQFHRSQLAEIQAPLGTPLDRVLAACNRSALKRARASVSMGHLHQALPLYTQYRPATGRDAGRLADEIAELVMKRDQLGPALRPMVASIFERWPYAYGCLVAMCRDDVHTATLLANALKYREAALQLAKASAINPAAAESLREGMTTLEKARADLVEQLRTLDRTGGGLNLEGKKLLHANALPAETKAFLEGPEADGLQARSYLAMVAQLTARLGLDPSEQEHRLAAVELCMKCQSLPDQEAARGAIAASISEYPVLASADPASLSWVAEHRAPVVVAGIELPAPAQLADSAPEDERLGALIARLSAAPPHTQNTQLRVLGLRWLFAPIDRGHKAMAALGVAAVLIACGLGALRGYHSLVREQAYAALKIASERADGSAIVAASDNFLLHTPPGFRDYRIPEVVTTYQRELIRESLSASHRGDTQATSTLIPRIRKLRGWVTAHEAQRSSP